MGVLRYTNIHKAWDKYFDLIMSFSKSEIEGTRKWWKLFQSSTGMPLLAWFLGTIKSSQAICKEDVVEEANYFYNINLGDDQN